MTDTSKSATMTNVRGTAFALMVLLSACGPSATPGEGTPTPGAASPGASRFTAVPTVATPRRLPGSVVRVSVNGVEIPADAAVRDPGPGPVTIVLTFPFAVDRASGRVLEGGADEATEIWTFMRTRGGHWLVSAIQQN